MYHSLTTSRCSCGTLSRQQVTMLNKYINIDYIIKLLCTKYPYYIQYNCMLYLMQSLYADCNMLLLLDKHNLYAEQTRMHNSPQTYI